MDLDTVHDLARETLSLTKDYQQGDLLSRMLFFASTIGGEFVGWDPRDLTDAGGPEYGVYYVTRSGTARKVAASFPEFVTNIALQDRLDKFFGWKNQNPADWPPQTFLPYQEG